jgi:hypothetical protein
MQTTYSNTYRVSERIVLTPGDTFRISGGPYWRLGDGTKIPMAVRGVCRFVRAVHRGRLVLLEVFTTEGYTVLHVAGSRKRIDRALVCRPYKVRGKTRRPAPGTPATKRKRAKR